MGGELEASTERGVSATEVLQALARTVRAVSVVVLEDLHWADEATLDAARNGLEYEFDAALDAFCDEWNRGTEGHARFAKEFLLAVGTRR